MKFIHRSSARRYLAYCGAVSISFLIGCATPWEKSVLLKDRFPSIDRVQGPTERSLRNMFKQKEDEERAISGNSLKPLKGTEDYLAATELYKDEKFEAAQASFKKVAKKYKKSEIREDALFMEAEAAWKQEKYSKAHDIYAVLLKEYPSTRHLNVVSERLFKIGRIWLDFPEVAKLGEIQQVNFDEPSKKLPSDEPPQVPRGSTLIPNLSDKKRPLIDTPGNGVAALTAVWMHDPSGPLADDSMMLVASFHARRGNYVEADRYFQMLREQFPSSPHVQNAFLLGGHVKLMSYQGPNYEGRTLQEAQLLKESTLRLYPNTPEKERLEFELARIDDSKALEVWSQAEFYLRKGNKRASAIYCHEVIKKFPKSPSAEKAQMKLRELGPEYESGAVFLTTVEPKKKKFWEQAWPTTVTSTPKKSTSSGKTFAEPSPDATSTSKPRRALFSRPAPPEQLPEEDDSSVERLNTDAPGRARL